MMAKVSNSQRLVWYAKQRFLREQELADEKDKLPNRSKTIKRLWANPEVRAKMIAGMKGKKHARKSI